jgi:hypothetical protein
MTGGAIATSGEKATGNGSRRRVHRQECLCYQMPRRCGFECAIRISEIAGVI